MNADAFDSGVSGVCKEASPTQSVAKRLATQAGSLGGLSGDSTAVSYVEI
ncbi:hypothetical protein [Pseudomonas sp. S2_H01]